MPSDGRHDLEHAAISDRDRQRVQLPHARRADALITSIFLAPKPVRITSTVLESGAAAAMAVAREELLRHAATQFDPEVLDAFLMRREEVDLGLVLRNRSCAYTSPAARVDT